MVFFTRRSAIVLTIAFAAIAAAAAPFCPKVLSHPTVERVLTYEGAYAPGQLPALTLAAQTYCLFLSLAGVLVVALLWLRPRVPNARAYLALILLAGLALRLACAFIFQGPDVAWSLHFIDTVHQGKNPWIADKLHYPPLHMTYLMSADWLSRLFHVPLAAASRFPWILFDLASSLLLFRILRARGASDRTALFAAGVFSLSPHVIATGAFQGACDSSWIVWTLLAFHLLQRKRGDIPSAGYHRVVASALALGVGIASKPIALLAVPAFVLSRPTWRKRFAYGALSLVPLLAVTIPHFAWPKWGFYGHLASYGAEGPAFGNFGIPSFVLMLLRIDVWQNTPGLLYLRDLLQTHGDRAWQLALVVAWAGLAWKRPLANTLLLTFSLVLALTARSFTNYFLWLLPFLLIAEDALTLPFLLTTGAYALVVSPVFLSGHVPRDLYMRELFGAPVWFCSFLIALAALVGKDLFIRIENAFLAFRPRIFKSFRSRPPELLPPAYQPGRFVNRHRAASLLVIFLLAFFLRILYIIDNNAYAFPNYHENGMIARSLLAGNGYAGGAHLGPPATTAFMAPAYPLLLYGYFATVGEQSPEALLVFQCLLGAFSCVLLFYVALRATNRAAIAALAALFVACSYFLIQSAAWMNVAVYTTFFLLLVILLIQSDRLRPSLPKDCALGALFGVAALVEPVVLSIFPFALLYLRMPRVFPWKRKVLSWTCSILCAAIVIAPWTIRNARTFKRFVPIKSAWWYNFWRGNNPYATGGDRYDVDKSSPQSLTSDQWNDIKATRDEIERFDLLKRWAFRWIAHNPGTFLKVRAKSAVFFWTGQNAWHGYAWAPEHPVTLPLNLLLFGFAAVGMVLACTRSYSGIKLICLVLLTFPLPYYLCHADIQYRYRMPMDPLLLIFAAIAVVTAFQRPVSPDEGESDAPA